MDPRARELIEKLELLPHPEGGFYREVYRSETSVTSPVHAEQRNTVTDIYFLLTEGQISRFHKVVHDEIWHFYEGAPLRLIDITPDLTLREITLGRDTFSYKHTIQGQHWQAARSTGAYTLVGCTVAPGFDFSDFSFLAGAPQRPQIEATFPELRPFV